MRIVLSAAALIIGSIMMSGVGAVAFAAGAAAIALLGLAIIPFAGALSMLEGVDVAGTMAGIVQLAMVGPLLALAGTGMALLGMGTLGLRLVKNTTGNAANGGTRIDGTESNFVSTNGNITSSNILAKGNINIGNDVKIQGVKVGEVSRISLDQESYMAIITSSVDKSIKIPNDSIFKISNNGFIGSPYIEIQIGNSEVPLKNNEYTINNVDAVSLEEIINNFIFK